MLRRILLAVSFLVTATTASASDLMKDFDALSGNDALLERAKSLNPELKTQIVQERAVKRPGRIELSPLYSNTFGGDAYVKTQTAGLDVQYHFNYRWSAGVRYSTAFNELTSEGKNLIASKIFAAVPAVDYMKSETIATVDWYPIYGKFNMLDQGVVHFDVYGIAGAGQVALDSGNSTAMSAGMGFAFWMSQHLTSRLEARWLGYEAERFPGKSENMNLTIGSLTVGYLL